MPGAVHLVREVLRGHGRKFGLAVCGAALFAGGTVASSMLVGRLTDRVIVPRFTDGQVSAGVVAGVLGLVLLVGAVRAGGVLLRRSFVTRTIWGVTDSLTGRVLDRLVAQPPVWHRRRSTGELIARAGVDPEAAGSVLGPLPYATSVVLLVLAAGVWLVVVDPVLGLAAVLVVPLMTMLNVGYQRAADRRFAVAQDQLGALGAAVHESVAGAAVVRAFGGRGREVERLAVVAHRLRDERMRIVDLRSTFEALLDALPALVNLGLLLGGAVRVRSGAMTVGDLLGVSYLFTLVVFPLRVIGYAAAELPRSRAGWARLGEVLDAPVEPDPAATLVRTTGDVDLTGLTVAYEPGAEVVSGVTLHVGAGERVAVVGHTGAGKTTLLHALAGLLPAAAGTVAVPDVVMLVPQEAFLVSGTVRDNVTLGAPIDDDAVRAALAIADAGFVDDLPGGLDATVGERGSGLSGGQRQRIALARSLARHPALLLLDDTTSALDPATERRVLDRLRTTPGMSTVAVASRPAVVAVADDVVFMAGGRIADRGPHAVLVARDPSYAALVRAFADHEREQHEREQHVQQRGAAAEQRRGDEP